MSAAGATRDTAIRVDFLTRPALTDVTSRGQDVEWPPHPHRLFAAMVAAHYETGVGRRETLEWLERLGAPEIVAPELNVRDRGTTYVPINDPIAGQKDAKTQLHAIESTANDRQLGDCRYRQARIFPTGAITGRAEGADGADRSLFYIWRNAGPPPDLDDILREVTRLGHSSSLVTASLADQTPEATWIPSSKGTTLLRVPTAGTLEALDVAHDLRRSIALTDQQSLGSAATWSPYSRRSEPPPARGLWTSHWIWTLQPRISLTAWIEIAEAIRGTMLSALPPDAPAVLNGHGNGHHVAIVPLAHVGQRFASGDVLGFAVLAPDLDESTRLLLLQALAKIRQLNAGVLGSFEATRAPADPRLTLQPETWFRPSTVWSTVTPVVLDRFPKGNLPAESIVAESIERLGLPPVAEVFLTRDPTWPGGPPSGAFRVRRKGQAREHRPWTHAVLRWDEPVEGPLVLGASRHFGLGFFRPWTPGMISDRKTARS